MTALSFVWVILTLKNSGCDDDIISFSDMEEEHLVHIEEIFRRLEAADLKMK